MRENRVEIGGRPFRYLERPGSRVTLLCLHGLGDTADQFEPLAALLPGDWRILALDQRGHGKSWKPKSGYSCIDFAADLCGFLDALGISAPHVFGHSMGGRNGLALAAGHPERVRSLILGDIGPERNPKDVQGTTDFFKRLPDSFPTEEAARAHWRERKPGYAEERIDLLMRNLERMPDGTLRWRFSSGACIAAVTQARSRDWWDLLPQVRCPVLLLHVEGSMELSEEVAGRMRRELPNARYVRVPDSGHNFHLENPGFAAARIGRFIGEIQGAT